jgi:deoxycytidylate deaminase
MKGPCAKRRVVCTITYGPDLTDFVIGENDCENAQLVCPREAGDGYDKCKSICGQGGHAEIEAIRKARAAGIDLRGAKATLMGHYWICEPCGAAIREAGIASITIIPAK